MISISTWRGLRWGGTRSNTHQQSQQCLSEPRSRRPLTAVAVPEALEHATRAGAGCIGYLNPPLAFSLDSLARWDPEQKRCEFAVVLSRISKLFGTRQFPRCIPRLVPCVLQTGKGMRVCHGEKKEQKKKKKKGKIGRPRLRGTCDLDSLRTPGLGRYGREKRERVYTIGIEGRVWKHQVVEMCPEIASAK